MARRAHPVEREGERLPAGQGAHLLLADVVRPAAPVDPLAPAHHQQREEGPVDLIGVEPVIGAGAHRDHRAAVGLLGVAGELAGDADDELAIDRRDRLLPSGRIGRRVVVVGGPVAGQVRAGNAVVGEGQVEDRGHELTADPHRRDAAADRRAALAGADVEARQVDRDPLAAAVEHAERRLEAVEAQVPLPRLAVTVADRAARHGGLAGGRIDHDRLPLVVLGLAAGTVEIGGPQQPIGDVGALALPQCDQQRQVGEPARVILEVGNPALDVELLQDHVTHRHREGPVAAGLGGQPVVGELGVLGVVG